MHAVILIYVVAHWSDTNACDRKSSLAFMEMHRICRIYAFELCISTILKL